jgi:hypothetical protein
MSRIAILFLQHLKVYNAHSPRNGFLVPEIWLGEGALFLIAVSRSESEAVLMCFRLYFQITLLVGRLLFVKLIHSDLSPCEERNSQAWS